MTRSRPVLTRLGDKMLVGDGCWIWTAAKQRGYGAIVVDGKLQRAHRVVYELLRGPIPEGLFIDHLCRNPACVRPSHLEPVTHAENMARSVHRRSFITHCPQGHEYAGHNLIVRPRGGRDCRACGREAARRYRTRKKEVA